MMDKLRRTLSGMSITVKFTILYAAAILIPSLSIFFFSFSESRKVLEREIFQDTQREFDAVYDEINNDLTRSREISERLSYNTDLKDFLFASYEFDAHSLYRYRNIAFPIIEYAQGFLDGRLGGIKVFMANQTIPEAWPFFYRETRLPNRHWYADFITSEESGRWIYPSRHNIHSEYLDLEEIPAFTYAQKIYSTHLRYLGIITVNVFEEHILSRFESPGLENFNFILVVESEGSHPGSPMSLDPSGRRKNETLYLSRETEIPGLYLACRTDIREELKIHQYSAYPALLGILIGLVFLEWFSYFALSRIFSRIHRMTGVMNKVAEGNFDLRIPIKTDDEIGQIAKDFNIMIRKINDLVAESVQKETLQKDAQLKALQFQINPHFIYNTIDTFRMRLIMEGLFDLADNLADFGKMLRYNMSEQTLFASLEEELSYVRKYLAIQSIRHNGRIEFNLDIAEDLRRRSILKFTLQPIVENSILHGLRESPTDSIRVSLKIFRQDNCLLMEITDNGCGISPEALNQLRGQLDSDGEFQLSGKQGSGIGLQNIHRRLKLHYGSSYGLTIESVLNTGTTVGMKLPLGEEHAPTDRG